MTVVEFARERRRSAGKKGIRMHGAVSNDVDFAAGRSRLERSGGERERFADPDTEARATALANRVREHRETFACSQQEFARESGISRATLSKIEQGRIYPSMQVRKKLAKALGVGPQELWNMRPEDVQDSKETEQVQAS